MIAALATLRLRNLPLIWYQNNSDIWTERSKSFGKSAHLPTNLKRAGGSTSKTWGLANDLRGRGTGGMWTTHRAFEHFQQDQISFVSSHPALFPFSLYPYRQWPNYEGFSFEWPVPFKFDISVQLHHISESSHRNLEEEDKKSTKWVADLQNLAARNTTALLCPFLQRHARLCLPIEVHLLCCPCKIVPVFSEIWCCHGPPHPSPYPIFPGCVRTPPFWRLGFWINRACLAFSTPRSQFSCSQPWPPSDLLTERKEVISAAV